MCMLLVILLISQMNCVHYWVTILSQHTYVIRTSDVNDAERGFCLDAEPRLSFSEKNEPEPNRDSIQTSPNQIETLKKYKRTEIKIL